MSTLQVRVRKRLSPSFTLAVDFGVQFDRDQPVAALFGPTGCGKSTTLAAIAGILPGVEGHVSLDGARFLESDERIGVPPERRGVGLVPQEGLLFPHMTVEENLRYGRRRAARAGGDLHDRAVEVLELGPLLPRRPAGLSGGERQRVALGRALLSAPRLLLLDEPVSALDEGARFRVLGFLERVVREFGVPALFVSHSRIEVLRLARTVVRMAGGGVEAEGPAAETLGGEVPTAAVDSLLRLVPVPGGPTARLGERTVTLAAPLPGEGTGWARLSSAAVMLAHAAPTDLSARNAIPGRVISLAESGGVVRAAVDVGQPLFADLTPAAARDLALRPGAEVVCVFKARSLEPLE